MNDIAIKTTELSHSYGPKAALRRLNLSVGEGEIFGLLGHNGAGKTTAVSLLTTLITPTQGTATIMGLDIHNDADEVRRTIGYLPENVQFYGNLTLLENLRFFARLSGLDKPDTRIREVLEVQCVAELGRPDHVAVQDVRIGTVRVLHALFVQPIGVRFPRPPQPAAHRGDRTAQPDRDRAAPIAAVLRRQGSADHLGGVRPPQNQSGRQ